MPCATEMMPYLVIISVSVYIQLNCAIILITINEGDVSVQVQLVISFKYCSTEIVPPFSCTKYKTKIISALKLRVNKIKVAASYHTRKMKYEIEVAENIEATQFAFIHQIN